MASNNVLDFPIPDNRVSSQSAQDHVLRGWRDVMHEFKNTHGARMSKAERELVANLCKEFRAASLTQWMRGLAVIAKYANTFAVRRYMQRVTNPILDLCVKGVAHVPLATAAREEFLANQAADAAQFVVVAQYGDISDAQLLTAIRAGENHIAATETLNERMRAELARRGALVAA